MARESSVTTRALQNGNLSKDTTTRNRLMNLTTALPQALYGGFPNRPNVVSAPAWSPLRQPLFRALWIASVTSNIGTWMHEVGAAWLMTSLTLSPLMVALMQTATSLPIVLLGLPAGALADVFDRRRMLLLTQGWMMVSAAVLGVLTLLNATTPWTLLILTFALGTGAAMNAPAGKRPRRSSCRAPIFRRRCP